jgi:GAF domain
MQEPRTWREFLATLIRDTKEKQRIAGEMGVDPITLTRWATRGSSPRPRTLLNRLVNVLPAHRKQLSTLIAEEFPNVLEDDDPTVFFIDPVIKEVPSVLYARILEAHATVVDTIRTWTISNLIMQQLVRQLDPEQVGIAAFIVQCLPPSSHDYPMSNRVEFSSPGQETGVALSTSSDSTLPLPLCSREESQRGLPARKGKVRSLREQFQQKSPALKDTANRAYLLGAESLVGYAIVNCRPAIVQDIQRNADLLVVYQIEEMSSAAAYPLQQAGRVAGGLLLLSTQKHFFSSARQALIQSYAHLLSLAFSDSEFYALEDIELQLMPSVAVQDAYLSTFNRQVNALLSRAERSGQLLTRAQAEKMVVEAIVEAFQ